MRCAAVIEILLFFSSSAAGCSTSKYTRVKNQTLCYAQGWRHLILSSRLSLSFSAILITAQAAPVSPTVDQQKIGNFDQLAREETWIEKRPNAAGQIEAIASRFGQSKSIIVPNHLIPSLFGFQFLVIWIKIGRIST